MSDDKKETKDLKVQLALEERKLIQSIINQQEDVSFKIRGWSVALFSGMTYIHIKEPSAFSGSLYFITVIVIAIIFAVLELRHMTAFFKLIERCVALEEGLNFEIQSSLNERSKLTRCFKKICNVKFRYIEILLVYLGLILLACIIKAGVFLDAA